jgi:threonine/homoserine/homoserine lactone efflux protein
MPHMLDVLRYCGIAYLFYLAIKNLRALPWKKIEKGNKTEGLFQFYFKGLVSNLLNPGSLLLYFALIPQFVQPNNGHVLQQNLLLGSLQMLLSFLTNCIIIFFAGYGADAFLKNKKYQNFVRYAMSLLIMVFAVRMLFFKMNEAVEVNVSMVFF